MEEIRVLMIAGMYHKAGIENFIMNILRNTKSKFQFDFLLSENRYSPFEEEIIDRGGRIFYVKKLSKNLNSIIERSIQIYRLLKKHKEINVVHIHGNTSVGCLDAVVCKIAGCKHIIVHSHNNGCDKGSQYIKHIICKWIVAMNADVGLGCSQSAIDWMFSKKYQKEKKCEVIRNGIELEKYVYNNESKKLIKDKYNINQKIVIGTIGRMVPQKNQMFLIEMMKYLKNEDICLLIVGDGPLNNIIKKAIVQENLQEKVICVGSVTNAIDYLCAMDVFLLPSIYEGLGIVLIEAQATNLPCIISENVVNEAIVSPDVYKLSLSEGAKEWAELVSNLSGGIAQKCEIYRQGQCLDIKDYDVKETCKRLEDIYSTCYIRKKR